MGTRQKPTFEDRVQEYVDSPMMTHRLFHEKHAYAEIHGNFGVYRTTADTQAKKIHGECNCPSEIGPCKHIHALRATWDENPDSFFDLDAWLVQLPKLSKASLVEAIGKMVLHSPAVLSIFGVMGFEDVDDDEEQY